MEHGLSMRLDMQPEPFKGMFSFVDISDEIPCEYTDMMEEYWDGVAIPKLINRYADMISHILFATKTIDNKLEPLENRVQYFLQSHLENNGVFIEYDCPSCDEHIFRKLVFLKKDIFIDTIKKQKIYMRHYNDTYKLDTFSLQSRYEVFLRRQHNLFIFNGIKATKTLLVSTHGTMCETCSNVHARLLGNCLELMEKCYGAKRNL